MALNSGLVRDELLFEFSHSCLNLRTIQASFFHFLCQNGPSNIS